MRLDTVPPRESPRLGGLRRNFVRERKLRGLCGPSVVLRALFYGQFYSSSVLFRSNVLRNQKVGLILSTSPLFVHPIYWLECVHMNGFAQIRICETQHWWFQCAFSNGREKIDYQRNFNVTIKSVDVISIIILCFVFGLVLRKTSCKGRHYSECVMIDKIVCLPAIIINLSRRNRMCYLNVCKYVCDCVRNALINTIFVDNTRTHKIFLLNIHSEF